MSHKIFLSHNSNDKPVIESIAIRLAGIFGKDQVFYDSWSIQPGDGIIDQMNKGLEAPEFVFFFVSANSLSSGLVKLEWQNALYAASQGKTRIIPVRVDGTSMPPVLMQTLYIDMHTIGLEVAIAQIVNVTQGNASFTPQHQGFSNLTCSVTKKVDGIIELVIRASHLMEPNPNFMICVGNNQEEFTCTAPGTSGFTGGFSANIEFDDGTMHNVFTIRPMNATLTPHFPVRIEIKPQGSVKIDFKGLLHQESEHKWVPIPTVQ